MINNNKVCGIIAEYNPFHNGHKYQLELIKKSYDAVVVVMSGSFTQRGDVAIVDKWSRTKTALLSGADLVIELPVSFALSTAERFAFGGISLLNSLGCIDAVSFGSECGSIEALTSAAKSLLNETPQQAKKIHSLMKKGESYAVARERVFCEIPSEILREPNNILGIEYIKHILSSGSKMIPITHKRAGSGYNDTQLTSNMASASAIRTNADDCALSLQMPETAYEIFKASEKHYISALDSAAVFHIRRNRAEILKPTLECVEGIENRIFEAASKFGTIEKIADACSTKRYTKAKIRRIILCSMLGINEDLCFQKPDYARVLGTTEKGREILSQVKKNSDIQIITKAAAYKEKNEMLTKDIMATDLWSITSTSDCVSGKDFTVSPVTI